MVALLPKTYHEGFIGDRGLTPPKAEVKSASVQNEIRSLLLPWLQRGHKLQSGPDCSNHEGSWVLRSTVSTLGRS